MTREEAINKLRDMITEIRAICDESKHMSEDDRQDMETFDMAIKALEQEPKMGHWVRIKPYPLQMHDYECSECGHETDDNTEDYCSNCGAKMKSEVKE